MYYHCNKSVLSCKYRPSQKLPKGLMPYCCMNFLLEVFKFTSNFLNDLNIDYWADYATLIGSRRYGKLLPWDRDVDFSIYEKDVPNILSLGAYIEANGFWCGYRSSPSLIDIKHYSEYQGEEVRVVKILTSRQNLIHSDLYVCREEGSKIIRVNDTLPVPTFDKRLVENLSKKSLYDLPITVPQLTNDYLCFMYGENYMETPSHRKNDEQKYFKLIEKYQTIEDHVFS